MERRSLLKVLFGAIGLLVMPKATTVKAGLIDEHPNGYAVYPEPEMKSGWAGFKYHINSGRDTSWDS